MPQTQLPQIQGHWFMGNLPEFNENSLKFIEKLSKLGDITFIKFGPFKGYLFNHPDQIHEVLVTKNKSMHKPTSTKQALKDISGINLFTGDGEYWKTQRKLIQPAFHTIRIKEYADIMVDYAQQMVDRWQDGNTIDMYPEMTDVTMNIVVKTLFDVDITSETGELSEAMNTLFHIADNRLKRIFIPPIWIPTAENRSLKQAINTTKTRLDGIIQERRRTGEDKGDLLSMLIMAQDDETGLGMTDIQVFHEVLALFAAGHETTANTIAWTLYLLSQNPDAMQKLQHEIDSVLGKRRATMEDLRQLPYTDIVVKESMRLYPTAWAMTRQTIESVEIGGHQIPKNAIVMLAPWAVHHDERWWDNPTEYRPERFSPENESNIMKFSYFPFGGGPRVCIGNAFAMMEARLVLATIVQHVDFLLHPSQVVEPDRVFTLRPKYGLRMNITHRENRINHTQAIADLATI